MTDSVETKDVGSDTAPLATEAAKPREAPKVALRPRVKAAESKSRPADEEKPAAEPVSAAQAPALAPLPLARKSGWLDGRAIAAATVGLVLGTAFGMVSAPRSAGSLSEVTASLEAGRIESARLNTEVERISNALATIRESSEAARSDGRNLGGELTDRIGRLEQTFSQSLASIGEKVDQAERAQGARITGLAAQIEKRPAPAPAAAAVTAPVAKAEAPAAHKPDGLAATKPDAKPDPAQTGSIGDVPAKPATIDSWAVREVFDGIAILENRRRRLIEVAPGVQIPGVGRVESIERRGRQWVVVTKQGLITPQNW